MREFTESDVVRSDIRRLKGQIIPDIESSTAVEQCVDNEIAIMSDGSSLLLIHNNLNVEKNLCVIKDLDTKLDCMIDNSLKYLTFGYNCFSQSGSISLVYSTTQYKLRHAFYLLKLYEIIDQCDKQFEQ